MRPKTLSVLLGEMLLSSGALCDFMAATLSCIGLDSTSFFLLPPLINFLADIFILLDLDCSDAEWVFEELVGMKKEEVEFEEVGTRGGGLGATFFVFVSELSGLRPFPSTCFELKEAMISSKLLALVRDFFSSVGVGEE